MPAKPIQTPHAPTPAVGAGYVAALISGDAEMLRYYHSAFTDAELVQVLGVAAMSYIYAIVDITGQSAEDLADLFVAATAHPTGHQH
jgi:hypothetical protein